MAVPTLSCSPLLLGIPQGNLHIQAACVPSPADFLISKVL